MNKPRQLHLASLDVERGAVISDCGRYRYWLGRRWGPGRRVTFCMLNPSTADARVDDHTIRKCIGFARRWGFEAIGVVNLFAWRATHPADLMAEHWAGTNIVGPDNDSHLRTTLSCSQQVVAAWGRHRAVRIGSRVATVRAMLDEPMCLGLSRLGDPLHPLTLSYATPLVPFAEALPENDRPATSRE